MNYRTFAVVVAAVILTTADFAYAAKSKCDFSQNTVDSTSGSKVVQTDFDDLVTKLAFGESEAYGAVSVLARGDQKFLLVALEGKDYYPLPEEFAQHEDPTWDPAHRDFLDGLLGDVVAFPVGSSIRLDLDDRSSVILKNAKHRRVRTNYANPGEAASMKGTQKKSTKLFGKLLKAAAESAGGETIVETSPHYTVTFNIVLEYPIDGEAEAILNQAAVTSMRIESRDRYYRLGWRSTKDQLFSWNKKSYFNVRDALQCVNAATGQGES
jgi:hypothetical protein